MASGTTPYRPTNNRLEAVISRQTLSGALEALITAAREDGMPDEAIIEVLTKAAGTLRDGLS
jgi:hypothetical protein